MDVHRTELIRRLRELSAEYIWEQFGSGNDGNAPNCAAAAVDDAFCKPCATSNNCFVKEGCSCFTTEELCVHEDQDMSPLVLQPSAKPGRSANKRVIIDSDEDDEIIAPQQPTIDSLANTYSVDSSPVFVLRVPASTRSKTSRRVISDSETDEEASDAQPAPNKLVLPKNSQNFTAKKVISQLDELSLGDSSARSVDGDSDSGSDGDDWIVNDSDEAASEEGTHEDSQYDDVEDGDEFSVESAEQENVRPGKKNAFIDLTQSPDTPLAKKRNPTKTKNPISKKTVGILSTASTTNTPARGKSKTAQFTPCTVTPSRKLSRTEVNQQRVEALSTGKKKFKTASADLAVQLYTLYNEVIFDNQLPADLSVTWNKRMLTTAGFCKCHKKQIDGVTLRTASIELSTKVVDTDERLRSTLIHEMCHAANWLIDQLDNAHHGKAFRQWGRRATKQFPEIAVTSCHAYQVHMPHKFKCTKMGCGVEYSRHTKKGLNTDKQSCGVCRSRIEYVGMTSKDGVVAKPRQASGFSVYVQEHFARTKASLPASTSTSEVMKVLAAQYKADKAGAQSVDTAAASDVDDDVNQAGQDAGPASEVYELEDDENDGIDDECVDVGDDCEAADDVSYDCDRAFAEGQDEQDTWLEQVEQQMVDLTIQ